MNYDYCIIGGGIVGLSTALKIFEKYPTAKIAILEKERSLAFHQSSRNSGVVHSGVYYMPDSLKSQLCREGFRLTTEFCRKYSIPINNCGKIIVSTSEIDSERLSDLYERSLINGICVDRLSKKQVLQIEPNINAEDAILCNETSIVNYSSICKKIEQLITEKGVNIFLGFNVNKIDESDSSVVIASDSLLSIRANRVIACCGLQSDRIAELSGLNINFRIIPFRGEYYKIAPHKANIVNRLIYPVPDPSLPFLGVHLTRMIDGSLTVGPNAVIGFSREGYSKYSLCFADVKDYVSFPGFWKLVAKYNKNVLSELITSLSKSAYLKECKKYCNSLNYSDLLPYRTGIRAQLVTKSGDLVHDFVIHNSDRVLHVCNAPSPAATSALAIGNYLVNRADQLLK